MKAKLIRQLPLKEGLPWYFREYELECIECGNHYYSGQYTTRTNPYCPECNRKHNSEKAKEARKRKERDIRNAALQEILEYSKGMLTVERIGLQHKIISMMEEGKE